MWLGSHPADVASVLEQSQVVGVCWINGSGADLDGGDSWRQVKGKTAPSLDLHLDMSEWLRKNGKWEEVPLKLSDSSSVLQRMCSPGKGPH